MSSPDVVVIGGGIIGAAIARELASAKLSVVIVERAFAGAGSTGAAMGHLVVMGDSRGELALTVHSRKRWHEWLRQAPPSTEPAHTGTIWIAADDAELAAAKRKAVALARGGVATELLDRGQLHEAEPELAPDLVGGLRIPDDMVCYPPAAARWLADEAIRLGAEWIEGRVIGIESGRVRLSDGRSIAAEHVVVAAGPWSTELLPELPLIPRRGHLAISSRTPIRLHHQVIELGYLASAHSMDAASVAFNIQPRTTGQLLIGSSRELVGFDTAINRSLLARMLHHAQRFVPAVSRVPISRVWTGFRPAVADATPLIGRWPAPGNLWVATGHEGLGITMAPGTAELITAAITGDTPPIDPLPYRPDRDLQQSGEAAA